MSVDYSVDVLVDEWDEIEASSWVVRTVDVTAILVVGSMALLRVVSLDSCLGSLRVSHLEPSSVRTRVANLAELLVGN